MKKPKCNIQLKREFKGWMELVRHDRTCTLKDKMKRLGLGKLTVKERCVVIAACVVANELLEREDQNIACPACQLSGWFLNSEYLTKCSKCVCARITGMNCHQLKSKYSKYSDAHGNLSAAIELYNRAYEMAGLQHEYQKEK